MMIIHSCGCKKKRETLTINSCLRGMQCITSVIEMFALIVNLGTPLHHIRDLPLTHLCIPYLVKVSLAKIMDVKQLPDRSR